MAPQSQGGQSRPSTPLAQLQAAQTSKDESRDSTEAEDEDEDEDEEEEEPHLKYVSLTKNQRPVYRNGDAVSAFLVAGDKMVVGTHNGNVHVFSLPSFETLRVYRAHTASISAISISPFPPPLPTRPQTRTAPAGNDSPLRNAQIPKGQKQPPILNTPSNNIFIGTASIDGNVCICSLINPDDVVLRKFGRPVQAIAVSPSYRSDRSYISGGKAGNLVLTVGGQAGKSSTSNTTSGLPSASGWLETIGLGGNNGTDKVLHSGEGSISTIKWSLSGKFVVWVNEYGIKIMRTDRHLGSENLDWAWNPPRHIDRPPGTLWDDMASSWRASVEWIDEAGLELDDDDQTTPSVLTKNGTDLDAQSIRSTTSTGIKTVEMPKEKLVVGWGGTVWILNVSEDVSGAGRNRKIGRVETVTM